jgi:hypothetical protein
MSMAGWYHDCLRQSGIRRRAGALNIRSFLITAAISSTGGQSNRVSSRDQCDANSLRHWRRRKMGCSPSSRRGNESRGAIIPSTTERRSVCLTARSPGEKRRDSASANSFATDGIHFDESWSPSSSSTFFKRRSSLIIGLLDATNAFVTCTTLELSRRRASIKLFPLSSRVLPVFP